MITSDVSGSWPVSLDIGIGIGPCLRLPFPRLRTPEPHDRMRKRTRGAKESEVVKEAEVAS